MPFDAIESLSEHSARFVAEYDEVYGMPYMRPAIDETLTIVPTLARARWERRSGRSAGSSRLVEMIAVHASSWTLDAGIGALDLGVVDEHVDVTLTADHPADPGADAVLVVHIEPSTSASRSSSLSTLPRSPSMGSMAA